MSDIWLSLVLVPETGEIGSDCSTMEVPTGTCVKPKNHTNENICYNKFAILDFLDFVLFSLYLELSAYKYNKVNVIKVAMPAPPTTE